MILDNHFSIPSHGLAIACLAFLAATDLNDTRLAILARIDRLRLPPELLTMRIHHWAAIAPQPTCA